MTEDTGNLVEALNERSRSLFRKIVESYLETGEPVGSRTLSQTSGLGLSAASIRNVMSDLEQMGLLMAPHTSAGRLPTHTGLRLFVDGLLEVGDLSSDERLKIQEQISGSANEVEDVLTQASSLLSGLCGGAVANGEVIVNLLTYFLIGAAIVIPIWLIARILTSRR